MYREFANRPEGAHDEDCQVRALSTSRNMPYGDAWQLLYVIQGERKMCHFPLVEALSDCDSRTGVIRELKFPAKKGQRRMNGSTFCNTFSNGRFIVRMGHHVAAVVDGVLTDTWDSLGKCIYRAWEVRAYDAES